MPLFLNQRSKSRQESICSVGGRGGCGQRLLYFFFFFVALNKFVLVLAPLSLSFPTWMLVRTLFLVDWLLTTFSQTAQKKSTLTKQTDFLRDGAICTIPENDIGSGTLSKMIHFPELEGGFIFPMTSHSCPMTSHGGFTWMCGMTNNKKVAPRSLTPKSAACLDDIVLAAPPLKAFTRQFKG